METVEHRQGKRATAARIYDYLLGGVHNFPADQEAARNLIREIPSVQAMARGNRALLGRMVSYLAGIGVRQFLDIGSGMPTQSNVHEVTRQIAPDARVAYVDIDPIAVAESLEILDGNELATAVHGDLRKPQAILDHPRLRGLFDFDQPIALLLMAVLHFVPDDGEAYNIVSQLADALPSGSYLAISHVATEHASHQVDTDSRRMIEDLYQEKTATPLGPRTREQTMQFFERCTLVAPGLVWISQWRPTPEDPQDFADDPRRSGGWAGVGKIEQVGQRSG